MALAQCYSEIVFGVDWKPESRDQPVERELVKELFVDSEAALFSIQNFCRVGLERFRREPGNWFGPFSAAKTIEAIFDEMYTTLSNNNATAVVRNGGNGTRRKWHYANVLQVCVFDELFDPDAVQSKLQERQNTAVLCFLCKKLGVDANISPHYTEAVKQVFRLPTFVGLACIEQLQFDFVDSHTLSTER